MRMSRTEFETLQASQRAKAKGEKFSETVKRMNEQGSREADLHVLILNECKRRGWIAFHGSMAHSTFRTPGEPDFVILGTYNYGQERTQGPAVYLIEAKADKGKLSPSQLAIHAWAAKLGHTVHVVRSFNEFLEVVK